MFLRKWFWTSLVVVICAGCEWGGESHISILVLAVDALPASAIPCNEEELGLARGNFFTLCRETVRFTHAFTTSAMTQSALATLLTARFPFEHGVRDNSSRSFLSANFDTLPEKALRVGYRTAFFSGGPPAWRGSGLGQGFEFFEDNVNIGLNQIYRPIHTNFKMLLSWLDQEVKEDPFLAFVYAPDLRFQRIATRDESGNLRDKGYRGQIEEIEESIGQLFYDLRKRNRLNKTMIVVVGLNGTTSSAHEMEMEGTNLFSENMNVSLFIKPSLKPRDLAMSWRVDANVSLADLGRTLQETIGVTFTQSSALKILSLRPALENKAHELDQPRVIIFESGWPKWRGLGSIQYAAQYGYFLNFYGHKSKVYNTLIDVDQLIALSPDDLTYKNQSDPLKTTFSSLKAEEWNGIPVLESQKLNLAKDLWSEEKPTDQILQRLSSLRSVSPADSDLAVWEAKWMIRLKRWRALSELGLAVKNVRWQFIAKQKLGKTKNVTIHAESISREIGWECWNAFFQDLNAEHLLQASKDCDSLFTRSLLLLSHSKKGQDFERAQDVFLHEYYRVRLDEEIARYNFANGLIWDTKIKDLNTLYDADLLMELPQYEQYKTRFGGAPGFGNKITGP